MNPNTRRWQISIATFFVILVFTASANALDETDFKRMHNLGGKTLPLLGDIRKVQSGAINQDKAYECLNDLYHELDKTSILIEGLTSVVSLASAMINKSDEQTVLATLNADAKSFLRRIESGRKGINLTAGYCSSNNV